MVRSAKICIIFVICWTKRNIEVVGFDWENYYYLFITRETFLSLFCRIRKEGNG